MSNKKILDDKLKIAEAKLTVHQSIGDAHHVLTVGQLSAETNYDRFKEQCRVIWQHQEKADRFLALQQFLNVLYGSDCTLPLFVSKVYEAKETLAADLKKDPK